MILSNNVVDKSGIKGAALPFISNSNAKSSTVKTKKLFNMHKFLIKYHSEDNIHVFGAINTNNVNNWNWAKAIKNSNVATLEGLIIFVGNNEKVLYIGHTSHVGSYITSLSYSLNVYPTRIFVVCNENPSMYVHAVTAYRAKFKPLLNSDRNQRFMFDSTSTVINLNTRTEKVLDWIKRHPNSTRKEFMAIYNNGDLLALCKCFNVNKLSYKMLKAAVFKVGSNTKVVSQ